MTALIEPEYKIDADDILSLAIERLINGLPQVECTTEHEFCDGVYARTVLIPAGSLIVGEIHRKESFFVIRSGVMVVTTDKGCAEIRAGMQFVTKPGQKRVGIALTDSIVTTYHANPEELRDSEAIKAFYTIEPPEDLVKMIDSAIKGGAE